MSSNSMKIVWWKVALGAVLLFIGFYLQSREPADRAFYLGNTKHFAGKVVLGAASGAALALGGFFLYSGFRPGRKD